MKFVSLINKEKKSTTKRFVLPLKQVNSVVIIWDNELSKSDIEELKTFGHEYRNAGKDITFVCFYNLKKLPKDFVSTDLYQLFCKNDFNLFGAPKSPALKALLNKPFDMLINGKIGGNKWIDTISCFSKASFRIGPYSDSNNILFYEIMIKPNGADLVENYLIEIGNYLNKIT